MKPGELYFVNAPISGFCFAWKLGQSSSDLRHGDHVIYLRKDLIQSVHKGQPICEVLTGKGLLYMDERWLAPADGPHATAG